MAGRAGGSFERAMRALIVTVLLLSSLAATALCPSVACAATLTVTSLADDGGPGTLRYVIENASPGDTIVFQHGLSGTITLDPGLGPLVIDRPLTIEGPGADRVAVDGAGQVRVLVISETGIDAPPGDTDAIQRLAPGQIEEADVVVSGLTFQNGFADATAEPYDIRPGGNVLVAGAIASLIDCVVQDGEAEVGGGIGVVVAYLGLEGCTVRDNVAADNTGDVFFGNGGGLLAFLAYVQAEDTVFEDNFADDGADKPAGGGAMSLFLALCRLDGCTVASNRAGDGDVGGFGGGILAMLNLALGLEECSVTDNVIDPGSDVQAGIGGGVAVLASLVTNIQDSLIAGNAVEGDGDFAGAGGGLALMGAIVGAPGFVEEYAPSTLPFGLIPALLVNCTVSGNTVSDSDESFGGGIWTWGVAPHIDFCTITDNIATSGGGIDTFVPPTMPEPQPAPGAPSSFAKLESCIVAGNTSLDGTSDDIQGTVDSLGSNIIGEPDGWGYKSLPSGCDDLIGVDPRLGPLQDNGGPTMTHALDENSPALDAACDGTVESPFPADLEVPGTAIGESLTRDQRGEPRPVDGNGDGEAACDIGAFEAQPDIVVNGGTEEQTKGLQTSTDKCTTQYVTIRNDGDAPLLIESIELTGPNASDFSIINDPSGTILDPGESIRVGLRFCPHSSGGKRVTLLVYSSDPDEPSVEVDISARATAEQEQLTTPANLTTSYLNVDPAQVLPGQQVTVSANVCNSGGERGSHTASLTVNGVAEQSQTVAVSPDSCKQVVFSVARAVPGTYVVTVDGMQGQFTVVAPRIAQASVPSQQNTGLGTAGILAIVAIAVALVLAVVFLFRQ